MHIESMRIAFVTPWGDNSAVALYAQSLIPHIAAQCSAFEIFAEILDEPTDDDIVERCWQRGKSLDVLCDFLEHFKPDLVYIEHQYALFPLEVEWQKLITKYKCVVKMHCVYEHLMTLHFSTETSSYLDNISNIIVHTEQAAYVLDKHHPKPKVTVVPHGFSPPEMLAHVGFKSPTLFSFGHSAAYKSIDNAIQIVKKLLPKYPDLLYMGIFSGDDYKSVSYFSAMKALVEMEGLKNVMVLRQGFHDLEVLQTFAQLCSVALFPYEDLGKRSVYGASGAVRNLMSWGVPVVTSRTPLFNDLNGVVAQGADVDEMVEKTDALLASVTEQSKRRNIQRNYLVEHTWEILGEKHIDLFEGIN